VVTSARDVGVDAVAGDAAHAPANADAHASLRLTLLTRAYCHLCDHMRDALRPLADAAGARIDEIDVDAHAVLEARFGERVPVLLLGDVDGRELCHYHLDAARVAQALASVR
jgi:hypothetical protein